MFYKSSLRTSTSPSTFFSKFPYNDTLNISDIFSAFSKFFAFLKVKFDIKSFSTTVISASSFLKFLFMFVTTSIVFSFIFFFLFYFRLLSLFFLFFSSSFFFFLLLILKILSKFPERKNRNFLFKITI